MKTVQDNDSPVRIFEAVVQVNDQRKPVMGHKVVHALNGSVRGEKWLCRDLFSNPIPKI